MAPGTLIGQLPSRKSRYFPNTSDARLCYVQYSLSCIMESASTELHFSTELTLHITEP